MKIIRNLLKHLETFAFLQELNKRAHCVSSSDTFYSDAVLIYENTLTYMNW